jgi:signal transduction histidine kinase
MIRKPWQIWTIFSLCLIALIAAMSWLSFKTIQLDALREKDRTETEVARQEAVLQERISSALYRMDLRLLPLVSQEAARPHYLYDSFYEAKASQVLGRPPQQKPFDDALLNSTPSPLMFEKPQFVKLHFQIRPDDQFSSPQYPKEQELELATQIYNLPKSSVEQSAVKLNQAQTFCSYVDVCDRFAEGQKTNQNSSPDIGDSFTTNAYEVPAIDNILAKIKQLKEGKSQSFTGGKGSLPTKPLGSKLAIQKNQGQDRVNEDFNRRRDTTRNFASQQAMSNSMNQAPSYSLQQGARGGGGLGQGIQSFNQSEFDNSMIRQGVMQPNWFDDHLILSRRIEGDGEPYFQCCWLDWEEIKAVLRKEVADLLPSVDFEPIKIDTDLNFGNALTTIPVQLVVDSAKLLPALSIASANVQEQSGLKMALLIAWCGLGLAAIASMGLLHGVMKLSERRASFVSAVTHELRTPLTTFRMYAEMLAEKMVPPEREQEYTNTLRVQADRLSHLVENVLQYARLERSSTKISQETVIVGELVDRFTSRLKERVAEAEMQLNLKVSPEVADLKIETQPSNVEQVLFNLVDNACKYAKPSTNNLIEFSVRSQGSTVQFLIRDHGPGIAKKTKKLMFQPFHKSDLDAANSAPGVGLGLALCRRMADSLGGRLFHQTCEPGACFVLELPKGLTS